MERPREAPRRALLHLEGRPHLEREDLVDEQVDYRRARPPPALERDYVSRDYPRERREEDYGEQRCVGAGEGCVCVRACLCVCGVCMCPRVHAYMYACMCASMCAYLSVCLHVCVCVCVCEQWGWVGLLIEIWA